MLDLHDPNQPQRVIGKVAITDLDMPFWSMVGFMLKWSVATIPAAIVLICASFGFVFIGMMILAAVGMSVGSLPK